MAAVTGRPWVGCWRWEPAGSSTAWKVTLSHGCECSVPPRIPFLPSVCSKIYDARNSLERKVGGKLNHRHGVICGLTDARISGRQIRVPGPYSWFPESGPIRLIRNQITLIPEIKSL